MNKLRTIKHSRSTVLMPILLIILLLSACDKPNQPSLLSEYYEVIDSGYGARNEFYWMDNNRIIFTGTQWNADGTPEGGNFIWNIKDGLVTKEPFEGVISCFFNNRIYYFTHTSKDEKGRGVNHYKVGKYGEEEEITTTIYRRDDPDRIIRTSVKNDFECRHVERPKKMANHLWVPLLKEHGYLEFGMHGKSMFSDESVFLHKSNGDVIELPFKRKDTYPLKGQYVPYKNAYFYWALLMTKEQRESWVATNCSKGWWIFPESGKAESECIPYTPWKKSHLVMPTKMGLFMVSENYKGNDPRESGGYLYTDKQFLKVIKGQVREVRMSPDGCKVALSHKLGNHTDLKVKMTLKVINICQEKG